MADETSPHDDLNDLLSRITLILQQPIDFRRTDPATPRAKVRLLTAAAHYFNILAVTDYGGRVGSVRDEGFVEQAVAAAFETFEGVDPHPSPFEKAAMLFRGITQGHRFTDGNKRTGFLLASYYLSQVYAPAPPTLPIDQVEALCIRVSAGQLRDVTAIAAELERLWSTYSEVPER